MPRKLIHSIRAITITAGFAAVIAMQSGPVRVSNDNATAQMAAMTSEPAAQIASSVPATPSHQAGRKPRARQTIALPFFSFAKALRRGNGG